MLPVFQPRSRKPNAHVLARVRRPCASGFPMNFSKAATMLWMILSSPPAGCWRDLLRLLQGALLSVETKIGPTDILRARQRVALSYQRLLRSGDDLALLAEAHLKHVVLSDEGTRYLLHHLCLLFYNGEGWYDIHPLLDTYKPVQEAIRSRPACSYSMTEPSSLSSPAMTGSPDELARVGRFLDAHRDRFALALVRIPRLDVRREFAKWAEANFSREHNRPFRLLEGAGLTPIQIWEKMAEPAKCGRNRATDWTG